MRKIILFVLILLLTFAFSSACSNKDVDQNEKISGVTGDNTDNEKTDQDASDNTTDGENQEPDSSETDNNNPSTDEGSNDTEIKNNIPPVKISLGSNLVLSLTKYLDELDSDRGYAKYYETKIQDIKDGMQPLLLDFSTSEMYFVCGYYKHDYIDHQLQEQLDYCCANKYTWVKYARAEDIEEYYNGMNFICAFQINTPGVVKDIVSEDRKTPQIGHFMRYWPSFKKGVNTSGNLKFDELYIYINDPDDKVIYHSITAESTKVNSTIPCVNIDGKYYLLFESSYVDKDGVVTGYDLLKILGNYYYFMVMDKVLDTERYSITLNNGDRINYAIVTIEDFIYEITVENREKDPELCGFFDIIESDSEENGKIQLEIAYQDIHYITKEFGNYEDWDNPFIAVYIECDYELAADEEWYKACENKEPETLNSAFLAEYIDELSKVKYFNSRKFNGLEFYYKYPDDSRLEMLETFYGDYTVFKSLSKLEYVTKIEIFYSYSIPKGYFWP